MAMLMNSVDNIAYNNGTLEKEFHYFTIKEECVVSIYLYYFLFYSHIDLSNKKILNEHTFSFKYLIKK